MKKIFKVASVLSVAVVLYSASSCVKEVSDLAIDANTDPNGISFTEEISGMSTRATDTAFESGDEISVTAYYADGGIYESNVRYAHNSSLFIASTPITYGSESAEELSFRALYPYVELSEDKEVEFTILSDQSIGSNYTLSDLMTSYVAVTSEVNPKLTFKHILTKMVFNLSSDDVDITNTVAKVNTSTSVNYNIGLLSSETTNDVSAVTMASNGTDSYKAIVLPQSYAAGSQLGVFVVDGVEYAIILKNDLEIKAGVQYSYSLSIADGTVTFDEPIIEDWIEGIVDSSSDEEVEDEDEGVVEEEEEEDTYETSQYYVTSISALNSVNLSDLEVGQVVVLKDGTYSGSITLDSSGTSSKPFRVRAETPGGVILTGSSYLYFKGDYIEVSGFWFQDPNASTSHLVRFYSGSDYCKLSDCAITGYGLSLNTSSESKWVSIYGTNNTIENCTIADKKNEGCAVVVWYDSSDGEPTHTIKNNYFERDETIYEDGEAINGQELIRIGDSASSGYNGNCVIEGNHFYHCHGEMAECISSKMCKNEFRANLFEESQSALVLRHGNGSIVEDNYLIGGGLSDVGGIRIIAEDHVVRNNYLHGISGESHRSAITTARGIVNSAANGYLQMKNVTISGNTLVDCAYSFNVNYGMVESTHVLNAENTTISNNTVYCSSSAYYHVYAYEGYGDGGITWSGNQFIGTAGLFSSYLTTSLSAVSGSEPTYPTAAIQSIRDRAGCSWSID